PCQGEEGDTYEGKNHQTMETVNLTIGENTEQWSLREESPRTGNTGNTGNTAPNQSHNKDEGCSLSQTATGNTGNSTGNTPPPASPKGIPGAACGGVDRWNDDGIPRCSRCWPPEKVAPKRKSQTKASSPRRPLNPPRP